MYGWACSGPYKRSTIMARTGADHLEIAHSMRFPTIPPSRLHPARRLYRPRAPESRRHGAQPHATAASLWQRCRLSSIVVAAMSPEQSPEQHRCGSDVVGSDVVGSDGDICTRNDARIAPLPLAPNGRAAYLWSFSAAGTTGNDHRSAKRAVAVIQAAGNDLGSDPGVRRERGRGRLAGQRARSARRRSGVIASANARRKIRVPRE
jgi:hypothetical protein